LGTIDEVEQMVDKTQESGRKIKVNVEKICLLFSLFAKIFNKIVLFLDKISSKSIST